MLVDVVMYEAIPAQARLIIVISVSPGLVGPVVRQHGHAGHHLIPML